jgi:ribosomal protein S18 acetylase RimI-like enzyme
MHNIIQFEEVHITEAVKLWSKIEHFDIGESDKPSNLKRYLIRNANYYFVAIHENNITGTILAGHDEYRGYIYHLATVDSNRRTGIASALLEKSLTALHKDGIFKCHAFVFQSNPYADLFWSNIGWQQRDELYVYSKWLSERTT